jgi:hypothetical protein
MLQGAATGVLLKLAINERDRCGTARGVDCFCRRAVDSGRQMEQGVITYPKEKNYVMGGRKVNLISADTGGNPAGAKTKATPRLAVHSWAVCREYQLTNVCHHGHDHHAECTHREQRSYNKQ